MQKGLLIPEQKVFVPQNFITVLLLVCFPPIFYHYMKPLVFFPPNFFLSAVTGFFFFFLVRQQCHLAGSSVPPAPLCALLQGLMECSGQHNSVGKKIDLSLPSGTGEYRAVKIKAGRENAIAQRDACFKNRIMPDCLVRGSYNPAGN